MNKAATLISKRKDFFVNDNKTSINISELNKERIAIYNKYRKNKIRKEIFNKDGDFKEKKNNEKKNDFNISNLNISKELKNENYIKQMLNENNNFDKIFEYINYINKENITKFDLDYIQFGLYLLNEKFLLLEDNNMPGDIDFINKYNFKQIIFNLLNYCKKESNKIDFQPNFLKLIYDIIINYTYNSNDVNTYFLLDDDFCGFNIFFIEFISDKNVIKNILILIYNLLLDNPNMILKIFEYNNNIFFNKIIDLINDYPNDMEFLEIILDLFICYVNIFQDFNEKIKEDKNKELEMKDRTNYYNIEIFDIIYNISLILIFNKQKNLFEESLYLISNIIRIISKSNNLEFIQKLITNKNMNSVLIFILEKDYSDNIKNIIYMFDIFRYIIKSKYKLKLNNLIINNNNINDILAVIINYLLNSETKEKIIIKILSLLYNIIEKENILYENKISLEEKYNIYNIIIKYIKSSNYIIREKSMKIIEYISNKKDYKCADILMKKKILIIIKEAIDPSVTYCKDEKLILLGLKIINNLLSLGEVIKLLNGVNTVLLEFENIGGKEMLENLQCNKSQLVFNYASYLCDNYFN